MLIIPAVDIKGGKCVRLKQGRADQETIFSDDPVAMGLKWQDAGAQLLHVVDLDGAFSSKPQNLEVIRGLRRALTIPMQLGGGIRTMETVALYLDMGIDRVILGTVIWKDPELVARALAAYPGRIAVGLDAKDGLLAVEGWTQTSTLKVLDAAKSLEPLKPAALIYTDISRDGVKRGVNIEATKTLAQAVDLPIIASGGVSAIDDIAALLPLEPFGVVGVITGRALYDGSLDLREAIRLAEKTED
jgi:phosphoribosylformimino-5-aminoimidazole carboxamide ribotide isomerase